MQARCEVLEAGARPYDDAEPALSWTYDYWVSKCRDGRLPSRRDIDMVEIPGSVLPYLMLFDIEEAGKERLFRYRLVGTQIVQYAGQDYTGRHLKEVIPADRYAEILASFDAVIGTRRPNTMESPLAFPMRDYNYVRRLTLPLSTDGARIDMIMTCFSFKKRPDAT